MSAQPPSAWVTDSHTCQNEVLPAQEYVKKGKEIEERLERALEAVPQVSESYPSIWKSYDPIQDDERLDDGAGSGSEVVELLNRPMFRQRTDDMRWCWIYITSTEGLAPLPDASSLQRLEYVGCQANRCLSVVLSPDRTTLIVLDMDKERDKTSGTSRLKMSELMHQAYVGNTTNDPKVLKFLISVPIYNNGTMRAMEEALRSKQWHKQNNDIFLPSDASLVSPHIPDAWHGLLGTRHGSGPLYMLADHADIYGKRVSKIHVVPSLGKHPNPTMRKWALVLELEDAPSR